MSATPRAECAAALKQASRAAKRGDFTAADRWTKLAERHVATAERLAATPADQPSPEEEAAICAEIRARIERYVEASHGIDRWEFERDIHEEYTARALREGLPMPPPLREAPFTEQDLERIARTRIDELLPYARKTPPPCGEG